MNKNLSTLANLAKKSFLNYEPWKSITIKNGIKILSRDDQSPICRLAICYTAGPRFERTNQRGLSHFLSLLVDQSKVKCTSLNFVRSIQQKGATIGCGISRESVYYYLDCSRDYLDCMSLYLVLAAVHPVFKPWEVEDMKKSLLRQIRSQDSNDASVVFEKLHEAAFRRGLGNSLYAASYMAEDMNSHSMSQFCNESFVSGRASVVGLGVSADELERFARLLDIKEGKGEDYKPTSFYSSEIRVPSSSQVGHAAVVIPGPSLGDREDYLFGNLLKTILGDDLGVYNARYSVTSRLECAAMIKQTAYPHRCRGISFSYSDGGLLGYYVTGNTEDMNQLVMSAHRELLSVLDGQVTEDEFIRAKAQYKSLLAIRECGNSGKFDRAMPLVNLGLVVSELGHVWREVDSLEFSSFQNFLKRREKTFAMSAAGGISCVPYLDELPHN